MLQDYLKDKILKELGFEPTNSQIETAEVVGSFLTSSAGQAALIMKGYAGTGKTTLVRAIIEVLKDLDQKAVLMAPTGRAAKVLGSSVNMNAYTIHKKIYRQQSSKDGFAAFDLNKNLHKDTLFIIDEASMISNGDGGTIFGSGRLLEDLLDYVFSGKNCRILLLGDDAQLPPVGLSRGPALDVDYMDGYGLEVFPAALTDVVRQKIGSGILYNATHIRSLLEDESGQIQLPQFRLDEFTDVFRVSGADLPEELDYCYNHYGLEETLVICRTNKRANLYNQGIRNTVLFREEELAVGDYLLVMKNNYHWVRNHEELSFIANGDIAEVVRIHSYHDLYGHRFADVVLRLVDYKEIEIDARIILDSLSSRGAGLTQEEQQTFFYEVMKDYQDMPDKKKQYDSTRSNDFYNALQVKFAYAMTCHKSQGGQWQSVFVDLGYFSDDYLSYDFLKWLYTAVTRATERLYFVNFPDRFFETND